MPIYWKSLYRERRPDESEYDKIMRRLSFKLPVVIRYNMIFALFFGTLSAFYTKKLSTVFYYYRYVPLGIVGLCYEEIIRCHRLYKGLPPLPKEPTTADLIKNQQKPS
jgi:hypothetical protein